MVKQPQQQVFQTEYQEKTCSPKWQARFTLPITENMKPDSNLEFEVWSNYAVSNQCIGHFVISLGKALNTVGDFKPGLKEYKSHNDTDGNLVLLFNYQSLETGPQPNEDGQQDHQQQDQGKRKTAKDLQFQGAVRFNILSLTSNN